MLPAELQGSNLGDDSDDIPSELNNENVNGEVSGTEDNDENMPDQRDGWLR